MNMPPKKISSPMNDIMIDLETLGTKADAAILSIGAVRFNETEMDDAGFYRVITIESNQAEHRTINGDTLRWWIGQTDKARAVFDDPNRVDLGTALDDLRAWIGPKWGDVRVYGNGSDFDIAMLAHAYGNQGTPWKFYNVRCYRTIKELPRAKAVLKPFNAGAHNALFDAITQAQHLQAIWKAIA